ncbi:hypothetical protein RvY_11667 [Ramazzottius varieornatus]|uniref:Uncharacterized protein n=1 Tax=Ramazzottius varieornatus TaxID=947166 RepID=A0A1D1VQP3_RAMVA|nr:hypothetical protein RvY_11667 [Ramazzottius varieornatus]
MGSQAQYPASYNPSIPSVFRTDNPMSVYYTQYPTRRIKATTWRPFIKVGPNSEFDSSGSEDEPNYGGRPVEYPATEGSTLPILLDELNTDSPVQAVAETVVPFYNPNALYPYPPEISIQIQRQNSREDWGGTYNPFALTTLPTTTATSSTPTPSALVRIPQPFAATGGRNHYDTQLIEDAKRQLNEFYAPSVRSRKRPLPNSWEGLDELRGSASQTNLQRMPDVVPYPQPRNPLSEDFYGEGSSKQEKRTEEDCPENPRVPRKL